MRQLARNAGEEDSVIIATVRRNQQASGDSTAGYNVLTGAYGCMLEQDVVDPVKVTRSAVQSAVSIAGLLLTTDALNSGGGSEQQRGVCFITREPVRSGRRRWVPLPNGVQLCKKKNDVI